LRARKELDAILFVAFGIKSSRDVGGAANGGSGSQQREILIVIWAGIAITRIVLRYAVVLKIDSRTGAGNIRIDTIAFDRDVVNMEGLVGFEHRDAWSTIERDHVAGAGCGTANRAVVRAVNDLNTADNFLGDFPAVVVRANQYGTLPFDIPHRFLAYGEVRAPHGITFMPALEIRSGFPFSVVNERLDFVGARNSSRFPTFVELDATILKSFKVPYFDKNVRAGVIVFNITNHWNPRDVQNNLAAGQFGTFFNSPDRSVRLKFEFVKY